MNLSHSSLQMLISYHQVNEKVIIPSRFVVLETFVENESEHQRKV